MRLRIPPGQVSEILRNFICDRVAEVLKGLRDTKAKTASEALEFLFDELKHKHNPLVCAELDQAKAFVHGHW